jgi:hypothetical protein
MAEAYGQRPSAILAIEDDWTAYQVDLATLLVGRRVESMTAPDERGRPGMSVAEALRRLDPQVGEAKPERGRFRDPGMFVTEKMAIPDSGVW